jgi:hypothetical protein
MRVVVLLAAVVAALALSVGASAESTFTTNPYFNCRGDDGIGVPNGSRLILRIGYGAKNPGLIQDFVNGFADFQVTINGAPIADPMQYWGPPEPFGEIWITFWRYDAGVVTFANPFWLQITSSAAHRLLDGVTREEDNSRPIFAEPGESLIDTDGPCFVDAF